MTPIRPVSEDHRHADYAPRSAVLSILRDAGVDETIVAQVSAVLPVPVELEPNELAAERAVIVCPQCEGEGGYPDGLDEAACHTECTRCGGNGWIVDLTALTQAPRSCCAEERERWSPEHTGSALSFEPGVFNLNRSGSASIAVRESEIEWETDDESGATYVVINLPAGEAEAIRKWLNEWLPVPATAIRSNSHD